MATDDVIALHGECQRLQTQVDQAIEALDDFADCFQHQSGQWVLPDQDVAVQLVETLRKILERAA